MTLTVDELLDAPDGWLNKGIGGYLSQKDNGKYRLTRGVEATISISFKDRTPTQYLDRDVTITPVRGEGGSIKKDEYNGFPFIRVGPKATITAGMGDLDVGPPAHKPQEMPQHPAHAVSTPSKGQGSPKELRDEVGQLIQVGICIHACLKETEMSEAERIEHQRSIYYQCTDRRNLHKGFEPYQIEQEPTQPQVVQPTDDDDPPF